jgi:4-cresol dehydrogenase (hydroxylating)
MTAGRTPLDRATLEQLTAGWGGARWFGLTAIYAATEEIGRAHAREVQRVLAPLVDGLRVEPSLGEPAAAPGASGPDNPGLAFLWGVPHARSLASVYWRKRMPVPADPDPDRDGCGLLWACPTLPFRGADVRAAVELVESLLPAHGFEPMIAMTAQTERTVYLVPLVVYDREVPGEDERARACHDELLARAAERGWLPYRLGIQSMNAVAAPGDDSGALHARLKHALDPDDVLAPGRYDFRSTWPGGQ